MAAVLGRRERSKSANRVVPTVVPIEQGVEDEAVFESRVHSLAVEGHDGMGGVA